MKVSYRVILGIAMCLNLGISAALPRCPAKDNFGRCFGYSEPSKQEIYLGEFQNGTIDGQGLLFRSDGSALIGEWKEGKLQGRAVEYDKNRNTGRSGLYERGRLMSPKPFIFEDFSIF